MARQGGKGRLRHTRKPKVDSSQPEVRSPLGTGIAEQLTTVRKTDRYVECKYGGHVCIQLDRFNVSVAAFRRELLRRIGDHVSKSWLEGATRLFIRLKNGAEIGEHELIEHIKQVLIAELGIADSQ